jgi:hypothetical protein
MGYEYGRFPERLIETWEKFEATLEPAIDLDNNRGMLAEVFKRIRVELKAAQKAGLIPSFCKLSIRKDGYKDLNIEVVGWEGAVFSDEYTEHLMHKYREEYRKKHGIAPAPDEHPARFCDEDFGSGMSGNGRELPRVTEALANVGHLIARIANRHNYDHSDLMTDLFVVGYRLDVETRAVEYAAERALQMESDPAFAQLHADTHAAINSLHPDCRARIVDAVFGRRGFESACEWFMKDMIRIAGRLKGRNARYDKRRRGWFPIDDDKPEGAAWTAKDASGFAARIGGARG